ncbi:MAG: SCO family protein [Solirubrobacteraceae bacterium]|jgi:protein SCO1/2
MRLRIRIVLATTVLLAIALVLAFDHGGSSSNPTSQDAGFDGAAFPPGLRAYELTLVNQRGRSVSLSAYRGKVVVLVFLFADCKTCVLVAQQVRGALDELASTRGVETMFVSTDPAADTRASVARFLDETSLSGRVEYLTGTSEQLRPVWRAYGVAPVSAGRTASEAQTPVLLIDRAGIERVGFSPEQITAEGLTHDIAKLQAEP